MGLNFFKQTHFILTTRNPEVFVALKCRYVAVSSEGHAAPLKPVTSAVTWPGGTRKLMFVDCLLRY